MVCPCAMGVTARCAMGSQPHVCHGVTARRARTRRHLEITSSETHYLTRHHEQGLGTGSGRPRAGNKGFSQEETG